MVLFYMSGFKKGPIFEIVSEYFEASIVVQIGCLIMNTELDIMLNHR